MNSDTETFKAFILKQMKLAGIADDQAEEIYAFHSKLFIQAFTHDSSDPDNNYQMLEAYGDKVLNSALFDIMWEKYPQLNQGSITPAFQKAKSEEILSRVGDSRLFFEHAIVSKEYRDDCINWRDNCHKEDFNPSHEKENIYLKICEDLVESFCGAMCKAVNLYTKCRMGPGAEAVYNWAIPVIDNLPFDPTDPSQTRNIKQRLKEFWDTVYFDDISDTRIANHMMFWIDKSKSRRGHKVIHATDPNPKIRGKRPIIVSTSGYTDANARLEAAKLAFPIVQKTYADEYQKGLERKRSHRQ